jgi:hypothetical protein
MKTRNSSVQFLAPCGINCGVCLGFLRDKNTCSGCWGPDNEKRPHCVVCSIKNCKHLALTESKFCYDCTEFPCRRIKQLDKRYKLKYKMSSIENLKDIKNFGIDAFMQKEKEKWKCTNCGGTICVHRGYCLECRKN